MNKFWKIENSKSNKLILIKDKCIYKGNPKDSDLNGLNEEYGDLSFTKELFSIPYSYIKQIENQKDNKKITIHYGQDSEDELISENQDVKNEIFEFIKSDMQGFKYSSELPSVFRYAKGQIIALLIVTGIFIWTMYLALQIQSGVEYELVGGGRPGLTGIVLILANIGVVKLVIGYVILLALVLFSLLKRLKSRSEIEILKRM